MKIKIFAGESFKKLEERINIFIADKINVVIESHEVTTHGYQNEHYIIISYDDIT